MAADFAVGRSQDPPLPVGIFVQRITAFGTPLFVDSLMATLATASAINYLILADQDAVRTIRWLNSHRDRPLAHFVDDQSGMAHAFRDTARHADYFIRRDG
ncbi:MAG: hypothetical protein JSW48_11940 [Betaproteobacteria bacterium]|nr:MAG: hypothetical protein JSW48_11940 [Betaproteobacteria bacterium]